MSLPISLSIIVPCLNEEKSLEATVNGLTASLAGSIADYEILIIDDFSTDRTGEIAARLAAADPRVKALKNEKNMGLGFNYMKGCRLASKEYVILVPGDNELHPDSVKYICQFAGKADMILSYPENFAIRPFLRRTVSRVFTGIINWISGYKIRYYNGTVLQKKVNVAKIDQVSNGLAYQAEILIQLLRSGLTFHEVPFQLNYSSKRLTVFRLKNVLSVVRALLRLAVTYRLMPGKKPGLT